MRFGRITAVRSLRLRSVAALAILAIVPVAAYAPSLFCRFVYDDIPLITAAQTPRSWPQLARVFLEPHYPNLPYYRPLVRATLLGQKVLHGNIAWPFHLFNVLIASAISCLAYLLLRSGPWSVNRRYAAVAALLFVLHPVASSCVYPISSGRETLMPCALTLLAMYAYIRPGARMRATAWSVFAAALLSKESAVTIPLLFVVFDRLYRSGIRWLRYLPGVLILLLYGVVRVLLFHGSEFRIGRLAYFPLSYLYALQVLCVPFQALVYEPEVRTWFQPGRCAALLLAAVAALATGRPRFRPIRTHAIFWSAWFVIAMLPTSNLIAQETHFDERWILLPSLGLWALIAIATSRQPRARSIIALAVITAVFAALGIGRARYFVDDVAFSRQWLAIAPRSVNAHYTLAEALLAAGDYAGAERHYQYVTSELPAFAEARTKLAFVMAKRGRAPEALDQMVISLKADPRSSDAWRSLAYIQLQLGETRGALQSLERALALDPRNSAARAMLAEAESHQ